MRERDVTAWRMWSSGLVASSSATALDVVRNHVAVQAQDYQPTKWSIAQRLATPDGNAIERSIANGKLIRTHVMRPTWHLVARRDVRWLLRLTAPAVLRTTERRRVELDLDARFLDRATRVVTDALSDGRGLSRDEIAAALTKRRIDCSGQRLPHLLMFLELEAVICSGPPNGNRQTYALFDERVPPGRDLARETAITELTRRYLASHGPAAVPDLRWWSGLTAADVREGLASLGDRVRREKVGEEELWFLAPEAPPSAIRGAHLLPPYDEVIVGYTKTRFLGDPRAHGARAAFKDRRFPTGLVLIDGKIAGHWRRELRPNSMTVEVVTYERLSRGETGKLDDAVADLAAFVERPAKLDVSPIEGYLKRTGR